ncbi:MAG: SDR family oxidoreductase [Spongiibacter sp.]|uniref:SDR family oxidoreductase n=1 Tax=Spongiibacter thalassae TaxID=2721624 RepID=A0ABX1GF49_9GAMM|nr:SDR family oxidoreductase [Spongiibacter thalassae]MDX1505393.1 SDR family oxidoreductase [Spongiibacter sp.]NKI17781.1 SDR family oxidoreductase [Spongiibacter thalassae]
MTNRLNFDNKVVVITGGAKGVGRGISEAFLDAGADIAICGRTTPESLPERAGRRTFFRNIDVRDAEAVSAFVAEVADEFGRIDVLINNAGGTPYADAATASPRYSASIVNLNLLAPLYFAQACNAVMQTQDSGGSIVNIASVSGTRPSPGTAAYGAAKAGLLNLTTSLAVEWAPKVRCNSIIGGLIQTEQSHQHYGDDAGIAAVSNTIPLGRMAQPRNIADACLFLASELAEYISGAALTVHGGGEKPAFLGAANADT